MEDQQVGRKFNSQTMEPTSALHYRANTRNEISSDGTDVIDNNQSMFDYLIPSANKEESILITQKCIANFVM